MHYYCCNCQIFLIITRLFHGVQVDYQIVERLHHYGVQVHMDYQTVSDKTDEKDFLPGKIPKP
jgi:hypothetical protein